MACTFCDESHDELYGDESVFVMLHEDAAVRGHAMVVWRAHVENIADLQPEEAAHLARVHRAAERALLAATNCERAIVMKLGIATPHLHLHIYPFPSTATREEVFAAIDGRTRQERSEGFGAIVGERMNSEFRIQNSECVHERPE